MTPVIALTMLEATGLVAVLALTGGIAAVALRRRRAPLVGRLYHVMAPEGGGYPEQFFTALHGLLRPRVP